MNSNHWFLISILISLTSSLQIHNHDVYKKVFSNKLIEPGNLKYTENEFAHIGMILTNVSLAERTFETSSLGHKLKKLSRSLIFRSQGTKLHLIFLTDKASIKHIRRTIASEIGRILFHKVIGPGIHNGKEELISMYWKMPRSIKVEFVDISNFSRNYRNEIDDIWKYFGVPVPPTKQIGLDGREYTVIFDKYQQDLFYIGPLYHKAFPKQLEYLIMLDVDVEFRKDVLHLVKQREKMSESQVMGVGVELKPHYFYETKRHRKKYPNSTAGLLGKTQGFNTGVVIYELARMRASKLYEESLNKEHYQYLTEQKYLFYGGLGDQDLYTQLGWEHPDLFHVLPCQFNIQMHKDIFSKTDESEIFQAYQKCDNDSPVIVHDNSFSIGTETKCVNIAAYPFHVAGLLKSLAKPVRESSI